MFGYVVANQPELKIKDAAVYRSFYCGLCRELKERYGLLGQLSLNYDLTFVILFLSGIYEPATCKGKGCCAVHPLIPQELRKNVLTAYAADMNILLTYYKCQDDWEDERSPLGYGYSLALKAKAGEVEKKYPRKAGKISHYLKTIKDIERKNLLRSGKEREKDSGLGYVDEISGASGHIREKDSGFGYIDEISGAFGHIMEEIFAWRHDAFEARIRRFGFYLGKFIYIMDAFEDIEKDEKNGSYNPFAGMLSQEDFEERVKSLLVLMMAEACREFEKLPAMCYTDILRNILYSGVFTRFEAVHDKRHQQEMKHARSI